MLGTVDVCPVEMYRRNCAAGPSHATQMALRCLIMSIRLLKIAILLAVTLALAPVTASADSGQQTSIRTPSEGPWVAHLAGFDLSRIRSVTYYFHDAGGHWHRMDPVTSRPFEAPLDWWNWDNAGQEAVT